MINFNNEQSVVLFALGIEEWDSCGWLCPHYCLLGFGISISYGSQCASTKWDCRWELCICDNTSHIRNQAVVWSLKFWCRCYYSVKKFCYGNKNVMKMLQKTSSLKFVNLRITTYIIFDVGNEKCMEIHGNLPIGRFHRDKQKIS